MSKKIIIKKHAPRAGGPGKSPWVQAVIAVFIFVLLASAYSIVTGIREKSQEISLSELSGAVTRGEVKEIVVKGDRLEVLYQNDEKKISQKEFGTALTTTFKNYEVPTGSLAKVKIEVRNEQGLMYWVASLAPILLPILF